MKKLSLTILFLAILTLSACQAEMKSDNADKTVNKTPVTSHGEPTSKGPDAPPSLDNGPDAPPPDRTDANAQAITTKENIRLTLPLKSN